jgi:hypothetical protein
MREVALDVRVVALRIDRTRSQVDVCAWVAIGLGLAFTTVNVQLFAADGAATWSPSWIVAWLLDPMVSLLLIAVLRAEQVTARWQVATGPRVTAVKWTCFAATYAMNTWQAWESGTARSVVLHSIPPVIVLLGAEVGPELRDRLTSSASKAVERSSPLPSYEASPSAFSEQLATVRDAETPAGPDRGEADDGRDGHLEPSDSRVAELIELLGAGCLVTGPQASFLFGCSERTGRRLLAEARAAEPPSPAPGCGWAAFGLRSPLASGPRLSVVHTRNGGTP